MKTLHLNFPLPTIAASTTLAAYVAALVVSAIAQALGLPTLTVWIDFLAKAASLIVIVGSAGRALYKWLYTTAEEKRQHNIDRLLTEIASDEADADGSRKDRIADRLKSKLVNDDGPESG